MQRKEIVIPETVRREVVRCMEDYVFLGLPKGHLDLWHDLMFGLRLGQDIPDVPNDLCLQLSRALFALGSSPLVHAIALAIEAEALESISRGES